MWLDFQALIAAAHERGAIRSKDIWAESALIAAIAGAFLMRIIAVSG
jgi:hypothetical protein